MRLIRGAFAVAVLLVLLVLVGGALYLGYGDSAPTTTRVVEVLPDDRFPR